MEESIMAHLYNFLRPSSVHTVFHIVHVGTILTERFIPSLESKRMEFGYDT